MSKPQMVTLEYTQQNVDTGEEELVSTPVTLNSLNFAVIMRSLSILNCHATEYRTVYYYSPDQIVKLIAQIAEFNS